MSAKRSFNARGKPHQSAKHAGNLQAELAGVGFTEKLAPLREGTALYLLFMARSPSVHIRMKAPARRRMGNVQCRNLVRETDLLERRNLDMVRP